MADLENLLLAAAGRTGASGKRPPFSRSQKKRPREGSFSEEEEHSGKSDDGPGGFVSRRRVGSHVPLKKRLEKEDGYGSSHGDEDDSDGESVGSDLYKDDADREALAKMSELDRENILYERSVKRDDSRLKKKVQASAAVKQSGKKTSAVGNRKQSPPLLARGRSTGTSAKDLALNNLIKKKSMKHQNHEVQRDRMRNVIAGVEDSSPLMQKPTNKSGDSGSEGSGVKGGASSDGEDMVDSDEEIEDRPSYDDVKEITIQRSKLAKWFMEPFFEELIVGCFVRVGIGMSRNNTSIYRLCLVHNVDASDPDRQYKLMNKTTHKYLNCIWGSESSAARWQMARVSDAPPTLQEFEDWVREVERGGERMLSAREVTEKIEAINKITNNFVYSASTVKQMLEEKKAASSRRFNVAAEKDRLRREMEVAESRHDEAEVERICARLKELEASRRANEYDAKAVKLSEMNRKNREENFKNASLLKRAKIGLKAGEAGYDPFSRRWTQSRNYYMSRSQEGEGTEASTVALNGEVVASSNETAAEPAGEAATAAALEAAADAGKLVDTNAPVDQGTESNTLHDFELPISLAGLQKFGGGLQGVHLAMMARKQRIEATVGLRVPENDGRCHALTLTVSDYKRRRGLL